MRIYEIKQKFDWRVHSKGRRLSASFSPPADWELEFHNSFHKKYLLFPKIWITFENWELEFHNSFHKKYLLFSKIWITFENWELEFHNSNSFHKISTFPKNLDHIWKLLVNQQLFLSEIVSHLKFTQTTATKRREERWTYLTV